MARVIPDIVYASRTDVGMKRLSNEDAYHSDPQLNLHVVCDGIGGQPSGEAASQIIAYTLGQTLRRRFERLEGLNEQLLTKILAETIVIISKQLNIEATKIPSLNGMGATIVMMLVRGNVAHVIHVGDSRCYLMRGNEMRQVTRDHTEFRKKSIGEDDQKRTVEKRLLVQYIGSPDIVNPAVERVELQPGDRFLLCTDGLTDCVNDSTIHHIAAQQQDFNDILRNLIDAAKASGAPDNITATLLEYRGKRNATADDLRNLYPTGETPVGRGVISKLQNQLTHVQYDLHMLHSHSKRFSELHSQYVLMNIQKWLGSRVAEKFVKMNPSANPMHAFHRAFALPESPWRSAYAHHMDRVQPMIEQVVSGDLKLSPILHSYDTAAIINTLWKNWRRVEAFYFEVAERDARSPQEQTLSVLMQHMDFSVNTLRGLLEFFPIFLKPIEKDEETRKESHTHKRKEKREPVRA